VDLHVVGGDSRLADMKMLARLNIADHPQRR